MDTIAPSSTVSFDETQGEVQFTISGFWELEDLKGFLAELDDASLPLVKARKRIHALGDMDGFVPQSREAGEAIRDHLNNAQKFGLEKIAIVKGSPLTKMQYKRLSAGIAVEFFDDQASAAAWLRA